jgi:GNAT superfamily N-acetyltransferase
MNRIPIRRATASDGEMVARFTAAAYREEGAGLPVFSADHFRRDAIGPGALLEAWIAETPTGRACGQAIVQKGYDLWRGVPTMVLLNLYVAPEQRRSGLARMLIAAVSARCMEIGVGELMITTGVANAVAGRFFAAIGAKEEATLRFVLEPDQIEWLAAEVQ